MSNYIVEDRATGDVVHSYSADAPDHTDVYPFATFNHILQKPAPAAPASRRLSKLQFIERLGDAAFTELLTLSKSSVEIEKFVKMIDWATPDPDGTSIDLDDPRVKSVRQLEPLLISLDKVAAGWADGVLA